MIVPVILCGGSGKRLRPLSSHGRPKQFLSLVSEYSLLQDTVLRAIRVSNAPGQDIMTVSLSQYLPQVRDHYKSLDDAGLLTNIISETVSRNTAVSVLNAAHLSNQIYPDKDPILWVLPSDAYIANETHLRNALSDAANLAQLGHIVTFGIQPSYPETGYGYIKKGNFIGSNGFHVSQFTEKPDLPTAREYLKSGYLWNSGMFVFKASTILDAYRLLAPDILTESHCLPFDKVILEKSKQVAVIPCDIEWSDIGSWKNLLKVMVKINDYNYLKMLQKLWKAYCFRVKILS